MILKTSIHIEEEKKKERSTIHEAIPKSKFLELQKRVVNAPVRLRP
jgi:hypothetical protein